MLDYIYYDEPLGFEKHPINWIKEIQAQDSLEEIDLGEGTLKIITYISAKVDPDLKMKIIELLKEFKDLFALDYNEMTSLSRDMVELKLPIRPGKKPVK